MSDLHPFNGLNQEMQHQTTAVGAAVNSWGGWYHPIPPTPDYNARLEAMRLAVGFANNDITADFAQTMKHAHAMYRFLTGQVCPTCGPEKQP